MTQPLIPQQEYARAASTDLHLENANAQAMEPGRRNDPVIPVHEGEKVYTADDQKIGTIKEVTSHHFKVHAALRKDYWLDTALVSDADGEAVHLSVVKSDLDDLKLETPSTGDALLGSEEQMRQRLAMEAELGVQASGLRLHGDAETSSPGTTPDEPLAGRNEPMAELAGAERGPDPQRNPEAFETSTALRDATVGSASQASVPTANDGPLIREAGGVVQQAEQMQAPSPRPKLDALQDYATHLREELEYVEREIAEAGRSQR